MKNRIVRLLFKETGKEVMLNSRISIFALFKHKDLGITYPSLCNVMRRFGSYENKKIKIEEISVLDSKNACK